jgi:hypothetical protein
METKSNKRNITTVREEFNITKRLEAVMEGLMKGVYEAQSNTTECNKRMERVVDRFYQYLQVKQLSANIAAKQLGWSASSLTQSKKPGKDLSKRSIDTILRLYSDINPNWLVLNEGDMLKTNISDIDKTNIEYRAKFELIKSQNIELQTIVDSLREENAVLRATVDPLRKQNAVFRYKYRLLGLLRRLNELQSKRDALCRSVKLDDVCRNIDAEFAEFFDIDAEFEIYYGVIYGYGEK